MVSSGKLNKNGFARAEKIFKCRISRDADVSSAGVPVAYRLGGLEKHKLSPAAATPAFSPRSAGASLDTQDLSGFIAPSIKRAFPVMCDSGTKRFVECGEPVLRVSGQGLHILIEAFLHHREVG